MPLRLIVGLGNPGEEHARDRHNAGFWLVDELARRHNANFTKQAKYFGHTAKLSVHGNDVWLLKPNTYMNRSGQAVAALANFYRIGVADILAVHDELDLLPGEVKMKHGGGTGGHNGLKDMQAALGSGQFWRLRLGIGHPRSLNLQQEVADFVLKAPRAEHQQEIDGVITRACDLLPAMVSGELARVVMQLHTKPKPPPAPAE
jgi:peptidyl-tRNA hydrolase, PTH1 family